MRIPGEERKFRRRRIVALVPVCNREREAATSQAVIAEVVSSAGVEVGSITGVPVPVGSGVGEADVVVGFVSVGEGTGVVVGASVSIAVGEGRESVGVDSVVGVS